MSADIKAGDVTIPGDAEVVNKDLVICHLDEGASLNMEPTADTGKATSAPPAGAVLFVMD